MKLLFSNKFRRSFIISSNEIPKLLVVGLKVLSTKNKSDFFLFSCSSDAIFITCFAEANLVFNSNKKFEKTKS